jgi:fatty acyl-CoA reductase
LLNIFFIFSHTAYVNGQRQGRIMERAFSVGDSIASEIFDISSRSLPALDIEGEIKLALDISKVSEVNLVAQKMKELGLER